MGRSSCRQVRTTAAVTRRIASLSYRVCPTAIFGGRCRVGEGHRNCGRNWSGPAGGSAGLANLSGGCEIFGLAVLAIVPPSPTGGGRIAMTSGPRRKVLISPRALAAVMAKVVVLLSKNVPVLLPVSPF